MWEKLIDIFEYNSKHQKINFYIDSETDKLIFTLNGFVQYITGEDETNYHEALTRPLLDKGYTKFLILGGGDGLVARNIFRSIPKADITLIDLDEDVVNIHKNQEELKKLNEGSLDKCKIYNEDALIWIEKDHITMYNGIVLDFPDPTTQDLCQLYNVRFLEKIKHILNGTITMQVNSDYVDRIYNYYFSQLFKNTKINYYNMPNLGENCTILEGENNV